MINQEYKKFIPHIVLIGSLVIVSAISVAFNIAVMGFFLGSIAAFATDPVCVLVALFVAAPFGNYQKFIATALLESIVASFIIGMYVEESRKILGLQPAGLEIYTLRIISILILAHIFHVFRVLLSEMPRKQTT